MNMKMIPCQVRDEHILGAGVVAGASGSGNDAALQMEFGPMWDALVKYVTFRDALGENPVVVLLTTDMIRLYQKPILPPRWEEGCVFPPPPGCCPPPGPACPPHREPEDGEEERPAGELYKPPTQETQVYIVPIPAKAKALEGRMKVTVQGYSLSEDGGQAETATMTASAYFKVLPSGWAMPEDESVSATHAQQLQGEIEKIKTDIVEAAKAADAKEAALEQAGKAQESADAAAGSAATVLETVEEWNDTIKFWAQWSDTKTYLPGQKVFRRGSSYICTAENTGVDPSGETEGESPWQLIAAKGDPGERGDPGPQGVIVDLETGVFAMAVSADGHLLVTANTDTALPPLEIDEKGHLVYKIKN